jgi:1-deoxy-D-xylulose-5-phosphate synthase
VWETLSDAGLTPRIMRVGLPDRYVTHGAPKLLHEEVGFTGQRIAERVLAAVDGEPSEAEEGEAPDTRWSGRITGARP